MTRRVYCGKKTKIYVPKTVEPKIISYKPVTMFDGDIGIAYSSAKIDVTDNKKQN